MATAPTVSGSSGTADDGARSAEAASGGAASGPVSPGPIERDPADRSTAEPLCDTTVATDEFRCFGMVMQPNGVTPMSPEPTGLSPADVQDAYNLPAGGGAGHTIGVVVAYDAPTAEADLEHYRETFGLPPLADGQFRKVDQRGGTDYPTADPGWAGEAALDVDAITAVAPAANIVLVVADSANFADMGAAVNQAIEQGAEIVNNSYGTEYSSTPGSGEDSSLLPIDAQYYDHPGVAMVASSGDSDFGVSYPASSNHVTAVGGTSLVPDDSERGWSESVWHNSYGGPGSGCSTVFDKLPGQTDSGCDMRSVADVSAVADPETGLSVYYTYAGNEWGQYGGTSLSAPLIAGIYALGGSPTADTYPNSYPYAKPDALFDVTDGTNGSCDPEYLCNAGPGYDGPTGLGTPNGTAAFSMGPHGELTGTVTDAETGDPIAGAQVTAGEAGSANTDADGQYSLEVDPGTYDVTFAAYGYVSSTVSGVEVADGGTVTTDAALTAAEVHAVSGTVSDGSGHGYPLYSRIDIEGVPGGPVYTDPYDGTYSVELPEGSTYTMTFTPIVPGYTPATTEVEVAGSDQTVDAAVEVDPLAEDVPGYTIDRTGDTQTFDGTTAPEGWTVVDNADPGWTFDDPGERGNETGGEGGFAIVDSDNAGSGHSQDSYLISPLVDMTGDGAATVEFDTYFRSFSDSNGTVEVSTDGRITWDEVWSADSSTQSGHVRIPLGPDANTEDVSVRFHYTGSWAYYWEVDNVFLGLSSPQPVSGGLLAGTVTDANTGDLVSGVDVTSDADETVTATTAPTGDPAVGDGFYWLFSPLTGSQPFTASKGGYAEASASPNVRANLTTQQDFTLEAGQVTVTPESITKKIGWGNSKAQRLTLTNTGGLPAQVTLGEAAGGFEMASLTGAPDKTVKAKVFNGSAAVQARKVHANATAAEPREVGPSADAWTTIADYPSAIQDSSAVFAGGVVYSVGGYDGSSDTNALYAYDPDDAAWTELASATDPREAAAAAYIGGKLIWTGGWGPGGAPDGKTEIYDPAGDSWTVGAENPSPGAAAGHAVLDGKLYLIGGCDANACGSTDVQVYDAAADSWSSAADYPEPIAWQGCGAINGKIYCAGGNADASTTSAYVYDPATDSWSPIADIPSDFWGSYSAAANGQLLIAGGVVDGSTAVTNTGYTYDPQSDTWTALPNMNSALYRGSGAVGFYAIGGNPGGFLVPPVATDQLLPGYDQGGNADVSWLSLNKTELTLAPGASKKVKVTLDAGDETIAQPGTYTAGVTVVTDTPYSVPNVGVTMTVKPPKTWGKIAGTVTTAGEDGGSAPVPGATVELDSWAASYTLLTDADGAYAIWIDRRNNPVTAIVAKDGFKPQTDTIKVKAGKTVTKNWVLIAR